jgi:ribosomal peptide maturation radical SAM protein 1
MPYDVVLVVSPFAVLNCPLVGPSVLAPQLRRKGVSTRVLYAGIMLAKQIGAMTYDRFTDIDTPGGGIIGEALFSHWAGCRELRLEEARHEIARILDIREHCEQPIGAKAVHPDAERLRQEVEQTFEAIPDFLEKACAKILSDCPKIVGFHVSDPHLTSAIALARRLKNQSPNVVTVMGGAHATSPMGEAISKACGVFDYVFSGEADLVFPLFVQDYLERGVLSEEHVIECAPVIDLDRVSVPDYDDYFEQMSEAFPSEQDGKHLVAGILFESSRSCWWGAKKACTFCGLDSPSSPFRLKSPDRVVEEIIALPKHYGIRKLHTADVAFPKEYYETVLPKLALLDSTSRDLELNVRPDMRRQDLYVMRQAGVTGLLCGIESFSTHVLQLLNKGVTAWQNICLLRDCRSLDISVAYVFLMGVPGEDPEEYRAMTSLIPKIVHLQPPRFLSTISIMRYSTYFREPEKFGITGMRPSSQYCHTFGAEADLDNIACLFQGEIPSEFLQDASLREEFTETVDAWCSLWQRGKQLPLLRRVPILPGTHAVQDTRESALQEFYLPDEEEFRLLDLLEVPRRLSDVRYGNEASLDNLLRRDFVIEHDGFLINVVTSRDVGSALQGLDADD